MPRAVWSGTISFGLVALPVRLFPATEPKDVRFHLYDRSGRRIRYRRVVGDDPWPTSHDPAPTPPTDEADDPGSSDVSVAAAPRPSGTATHGPTGASTDRQGSGESEVTWDDVARGVEDELGRVVLLSSEEIERARPERSRTIDIEDFVRLEDIDPVYFEKSYYLAPSSAPAIRPYVLLQRTLAEAGRVGIGRFVLRTRPHLVAIRPTRGVLGLETLYFGDEVREPSEVVPGVDGVDVSERELELAERLVATLERQWDPAAYADTYREELLRMLAEKEPVRDVPAPAAIASVDAGSAVDDLMRALRESVEAAKQRGAARSATTPKRKKRGAAEERRGA